MEKLEFREAGRSESMVYQCETEVCGGKKRDAVRDGFAHIFIGFDSAGSPRRSVIVCPSCYRSAVEVR